MFRDAESRVDAGCNVLIVTDRGATRDDLVIPVLLAVSGLNNYLVRKGKRGLVSIVADTCEACEVHHYATLLGYGASAIHPYGVYATLDYYDLSDKKEAYRSAAEKGIIKIMSRMGISTIVGYQGAQLFEAVGISKEVVDEYFTGTVSRIGGLTLIKSKKSILNATKLHLAKKQMMLFRRMAVSSIVSKANITCSIR